MLSGGNDQRGSTHKVVEVLKVERLCNILYYSLNNVEIVRRRRWFYVLDFHLDSECSSTTFAHKHPKGHCGRDKILFTLLLRRFFFCCRCVRSLLSCLFFRHNYRRVSDVLADVAAAAWPTFSLIR